ncbi:hypothetical protein [Chitinimonas sp.]|uniref:hypothetical protein n=1 Tax=Chitinimonas sp. TaxID=1934313 RepID=UPI002F92FEB4
MKSLAAFAMFFACLAFSSATRAADTADSPSYMQKMFGKQEDFPELKKKRRLLSNEITRLEEDSRQLENLINQLTPLVDDAEGELSKLSYRYAEINAAIAEKEGQPEPEDSAKTPEQKGRNSGKNAPKNSTATAKSKSKFLLGSAYEDTPIEALREYKSTNERRRNEIANNQKTLQRAKDSLKEKRDAMSKKQEELYEMDERIAHALNVGSEQYIYRTVVSLIFAVIVFYLVLQFFKIVQGNDEVKKSIFAGDAGIQFITLFSIVIAVILFGILEILGANELSALLGGLSGYILGKSAPKAPPPCPHAAHPAPAEPPVH